MYYNNKSFFFAFLKVLTDLKIGTKATLKMAAPGGSGSATLGGLVPPHIMM